MTDGERVKWILAVLECRWVHPADAMKLGGITRQHRRLKKMGVLKGSFETFLSPAERLWVDQYIATARKE